MLNLTEVFIVVSDNDWLFLWINLISCIWKRWECVSETNLLWVHIHYHFHSWGNVPYVLFISITNSNTSWMHDKAWHNFPENWYHTVALFDWQIMAFWLERNCFNTNTDSPWLDHPWLDHHVSLFSQNNTIIFIASLDCQEFNFVNVVVFNSCVYI